MKIKLKYLKLGGFRNEEEKQKELLKLLFHKDKTILNSIIKYISNDLTTEQVKKFIEIKNFEKVFKDKEYQCVVKFIFSTYGDLIVEVIKFGKRDMYEEMKQQQFKNLESGLLGDDYSIF